MKHSASFLTRCAILTCAALMLSLVESWLPVAAIPIPGVKLGLSNIALLIALLRFGAPTAWCVLLAKCGLSALLSGNMTALFFSLCGGVLALCAMILLRRCPVFSLFGISIGGAAAHGIGQILAAGILAQTFGVLSYLPILLLIGLLTGALTAALAALVDRYLPKP